jgi:hypothetical protein
VLGVYKKNYHDKLPIKSAIGKNIDATIVHIIPATNTINNGSIILVNHSTFVSSSSL